MTENNPENALPDQDLKNEILIGFEEPLLKDMLDMLLEESEFLLDDKVFKLLIPC